MAWTYLILVGLLEIGWPVGLKQGWSENGLRPAWIGFSILCMALSGTCLFLAQKHSRGNRLPEKIVARP